MIELHDETGRVIFISARHIAALIPCGDSTTVCLSSGRSITVKESINDIAVWVPSARRDA